MVYFAANQLVRGPHQEADVSDREGKDSERYYLTYQRSVVLGLVFVVCLGAYYMLGVVLAPDDSGPRFPWGLLIAAAYVALLLILELVTLRGRLWYWRRPAERTVFNDEWIRANRSRAYQIAFWVVLGVQWPMMFVMADVPSTPVKGVIGMGMMTAMIGLATFLAAYLYYSRQPRDG